MKIVDIREETKPIKSNIRNAYIDFSKMTLSLVAVVTDVIRDGKPVIGYGFNSNGRYGQGALMRERFLPRIREADPASLLADPARATASPVLPPIGRLIRPAEVAALVAYLLSPEAAAITGQDIQICGGSSLNR